MLARVWLFLVIFSSCDNKQVANSHNITKDATRSVQAEKVIIQIQMSIAALEVALNEAAKIHIDEAISLIKRLKVSAPKLSNEQLIKLGQISYTSETPAKDYLIHIAENTYILDDCTRQQSTTKQQRIHADVEIMHSSFALDLESTERALLKVNIALSDGNNALAKKILNSIFANAILDQFMLNNPLNEVLENLEIVKLLINDHRFYATNTSLSNIQILLQDSDDIHPSPFTQSLLIRAETLRQNIEKESTKLLPTINRDITLLNQDIKEYLQIRKLKNGNFH